MRRVFAALLAAPLLVTVIGLPAYAGEVSGEVSGVGYFDPNEDGQQQANEPGAGGFTVELISASGGWRTSVRTDENGNYRFTDLAEGKYSVQFVSDGHDHTTPWAVGARVNPDSETTVNFGIK